MEKAYIIKGVNPLGRIMEMRLIAPSAVAAKKQAEEAGLGFVVVREATDQDIPAPPPPDPPEPL